MAQFSFDSVEEADARTWHPFPGLCRGCLGRNVPRCCETTEVIQTDYIDMRQQSLQPLHTPPITSGTKGIPVVNRIAPQLPLRAEIVRRNPGDEEGPTLLV